MSAPTREWPQATYANSSWSPDMISDHSQFGAAGADDFSPDAHPSMAMYVNGGKGHRGDKEVSGSGLSPTAPGGQTSLSNSITAHLEGIAARMASNYLMEAGIVAPPPIYPQPRYVHPMPRNDTPPSAGKSRFAPPTRIPENGSDDDDVPALELNMVSQPQAIPSMPYSLVTQNQLVGDGKYKGAGALAPPGLEAPGTMDDSWGAGSSPLSSADLDGAGAAEAEEAEKVVDWRGKTTIMMRNIPNRYNQALLVTELEEFGFDGSYDFLYLPMNADRNGNRGYAFINFLAEESVRAFRDIYHGAVMGGIRSKEPISILPAALQGLEQNFAHYSSTRVMREFASRPLFLSKPKGFVDAAADFNKRSRGRRRGPRHSLIDIADKANQVKERSGSAMTVASAGLDLVQFGQMASDEHPSGWAVQAAQSPPMIANHLQSPEQQQQQMPRAGGDGGRRCYCPWCGQNIDASFQFCQFCGTPVKNAIQSTVTTRL